MFLIPEYRAVIARNIVKIYRTGKMFAMVACQKIARVTSRMTLPNVLCTGPCGLILTMSMLIKLVVIVPEVTILHLLIHACVPSKIGVNVRVVGI